MKFLITGGRKLKGKIEVYGAKNAAMKMIAATLLTGGEFKIENVPDILDIAKEIQILERLGAKITRDGHQLNIDTREVRNEPLDCSLVKSLRASVVLVGSMLIRFGEVTLPHPGGCMIGARPIDRHIKAFRDLGVTVRENEEGYKFTKQETHSNKVKFEEITWTGTENILIFASGLKQTTTIENIALEPEVFNLIEMLNSMGAKISVDGRTAKVTGTDKLHATNATCIPDRLEAATFIIMAAAVGEGIEITNCRADHLEALWQKFSEMGIKFEKRFNSVYIEEPDKIKAVNLETAEYPGFITDAQPPMGLLCTQAEGTSTIKENIFENRLEYLKQLQKMGAEIEIVDSRVAKITGPTKLKAGELQSLDLRAGATLIIGGLLATGQTILDGAENIDRGYEKIEERLSQIGAEIKRAN